MTRAETAIRRLVRAAARMGYDADADDIERGSHSSWYATVRWPLVIDEDGDTLLSYDVALRVSNHPPSSRWGEWAAARVGLVVGTDPYRSGRRLSEWGFDRYADAILALLYIARDKGPARVEL